MVSTGRSDEHSGTLSTDMTAGSSWEILTSSGVDRRRPLSSLYICGCSAGDIGRQNRCNGMFWNPNLSVLAHVPERLNVAIGYVLDVQRSLG